VLQGNKFFMCIQAWRYFKYLLYNTNSATWLQWCGRDRNLRDLVKDRDETETSSKTSRPRLDTWSSRPRFETSKLVHFAKNFILNVVITSDFNFFQISGIFPTCFTCFLPANTTNKKSLNYKNFNKPFLCNIQSFQTWCSSAKLMRATS